MKNKEIRELRNMLLEKTHSPLNYIIHFTKSKRLVVSIDVHRLLRNLILNNMARRIHNSQTTLLSDQQQKPQEVSSYGCLSYSPSDVMHCVSNGIHSVASTTRILFTEFEGVMKEILPKLSADECRQVRETFGQYQSMLMTTQEFLTRTTLRINHAETQEDLVRAIDIDTLMHLCDTTAGLLPKFWALNILIDEKVKDERAIKMWRNISLGLAGLAGSVLLIGTGVGMAVGFTSAVKGVLLIAGATTVVGLTASGIAQAAQKLSAFEQVIKNLKEIKQLLSQLSQRYSMIRGMQGELRTSDRLEFLGILKETKAEVDRGFEILGRF